MDRMFCVSDLHGHLELYNQIKAFLDPTDKVVCLGDCGDRGPQSWETIKAVAADPQWTYLMGNHEEMLLAAMYKYLGDDRWYDIGYDDPIGLLAFNGGYETLQGWIKDGANPDWIKFLENLLKEYTYIPENGLTINLSHAGYTPGKTKDLLWSRSHFHDKWSGNDKEIIIHGHTPCYHLVNVLTDGSGRIWSVNDGAVWYADGHKIDIDMGTYVYGAALLMDLDTFDEHIFTIS